MKNDLHATLDPSAFLLSEVQRVDGETILVADCAGYEVFEALPRVLNYEGKNFGLTGWSSDTDRAYWRVSAANRVAYRV